MKARGIRMSRTRPMSRLSPARDVHRDTVGARSRRRALPVSEFVELPGGSIGPSFEWA